MASKKITHKMNAPEMIYDLPESKSIKQLNVEAHKEMAEEQMSLDNPTDPVITSSSLSAHDMLKEMVAASGIGVSPLAKLVGVSGVTIDGILADPNKVSRKDVTKNISDFYAEWKLGKHELKPARRGRARKDGSVPSTPSAPKTKVVASTGGIVNIKLLMLEKENLESKLQAVNLMIKHYS
jgi:hypothetical protein